MPTTGTLIAKTILGSSAASVSFSAIPGSYTDLLLVSSARCTATGSISIDQNFSVNGSNANNSYRLLYVDNGSVSSSSATGTAFPGRVATASATNTIFATTEAYFPNYSGFYHKSLSITSHSISNSTNVSSLALQAVAGLIANGSAITDITITPSSGNFVSGSSFFLYGITKA